MRTDIGSRLQRVQEAVNRIGVIAVEIMVFALPRGPLGFVGNGRFDAPAKRQLRRL